MATEIQQKIIQKNEIDFQSGQVKKRQGQSIYFQHQNLNLLCGMHSLNNFLGQPKYNVDSMNEICYTLAEGKKILNPHKHWIMQGDYDINVLMFALQQCGFSTKWHDKRKTLQASDLQNIQGLLINIQVKRDSWFKWSGLCCASGRHWLTVRKINNQKLEKDNYYSSYIILDSSKRTYARKNQQEIFAYLNQAQKQTAQLIFIQKSTKQQLWKKRINISKYISFIPFFFFHCHHLFLELGIKN